MANNQAFIEELVRRVQSVIPAGLSEMRADMEKNVRAVMQNAFSQLDLVTREEFDVQSEVLTRTREKLAQLEQQVSELEAILKIDKPVGQATKVDIKTNETDDKNQE